MGLFTIAEIVILPFPYSDLSVSKLRPALILTNINNDDYIMVQITSKSYDDKYSIKISNDDLSSGNLMNDSYVKFSKIFTANKQIITKSIGKLKFEKYSTIILSLIDLLKRNLNLNK